jgi:hypothetical protein
MIRACARGAVKRLMAQHRDIGGSAPKPPEFFALGQWAIAGQAWCRGAEFAAPRHEASAPLAKPAAPVALRQSRTLRATSDASRQPIQYQKFPTTC